MKINDDELKAEGFRRAGRVFRDAAKVLRVEITDQNVRGFVVYMMVVNHEVQKAGTTGRGNATFAARMHSTFGVLRQVIAGVPPGRRPARWRSRPLDPFKQHAPAPILAGQEVELWVLECPSFASMMAKEKELNDKYTPEWTKEGRAANKGRQSVGSALGSRPAQTREKSKMAPSDGQRNFEERRMKCSPAVREVLDFLMKAAANVGPDVEKPPTPEVKGEGVKYRSGSGQFCAIHPKQEEHVWVLLAHDRADRAALVSELRKARLTFTREDTDGPWIKVGSMQEAVRLISFLVRAYDGKSAQGPGRTAR